MKAAALCAKRSSVKQSTWPDHVRLVLYKGKDEYSIYADPNCSEAYDKVISEDFANQLRSVQEMVTVWEGARGDSRGDCNSGPPLLCPIQF